MKRTSTPNTLSILSRTICIAFFALCGTSEKAASQTSTPNIDFNTGTFSNWTCWVGHASDGTATTGSLFDSGVISSPISGHAPGIDPITAQYYPNQSRHFITSGTDTDYYGGFPIVSPLGGTHSLRLGNDSCNFRADRVQYFVHVPSTATSFNLQVQYAIVMQDPVHQAYQQPTFLVTAYDSATGSMVPTANNLYIAHYNFPGFIYSTANHYYYGSDSIFYLPWTTSTVNLTGMAGKTVTLECTALDCAQGGHFCYGYFDVVGSADSLVASLLRYNAAGDSVVLQGPPGYKYYKWQNQNMSQTFNAATDTSRTKMLPAPATQQYYNLTLTPYAANGVPVTIHSPLLKSKKLGISTASLAETSIYPNPSNAAMHIAFNAPFEGTVTLINAQGQITHKADLLSSKQYDIPTTDMATGIYRLQIKDNGGSEKTFTVSIKH